MYSIICKITVMILDITFLPHSTPQVTPTYYRPRLVRTISQAEPDPAGQRNI